MTTLATAGGALPLPATRPVRAKRVLPGFGLSMGVTLLYLAVIILAPLTALALQGAEIGIARWWAIITAPRAIAAFQITFGAAAIATVFNAIYGLLMAWVLVRCEFPGKRLVDALMDAPFALPTAVAGITLTALYSRNGWFGAGIEASGVQVVFTIWGVALAMAFTSAPFVVRTIQPVLEDIDPQIEQAAETLGASRIAIFFRVVFPLILPAFLAGSALAFARSLGEFGAIVFIAGNLPFRTEIAALLAFIRLEEYDYAGASAIALALLLAAFVLLMVSNVLQAWAARFREARS